MNRIRYVKTVDGTFKPMRTIKNEAGQEFDVTIQVQMDGVKQRGVIVSNGVVLYDEIKQSHHKIKISLKKELMKHGVVFTKEKRGRSEV